MRRTPRGCLREPMLSTFKDVLLQVLRPQPLSQSARAGILAPCNPLASRLGPPPPAPQHLQPFDPGRPCRPLLWLPGRRSGTHCAP